jgi:hypothetical protein
MIKYNLLFLDHYEVIPHHIVVCCIGSREFDLTGRKSFAVDIEVMVLGHDLITFFFFEIFEPFGDGRREKPVMYILLASILPALMSLSMAVFISGNFCFHSLVVLGAMI